jgi:hypothetical protein
MGSLTRQLFGAKSIKPHQRNREYIMDYVEKKQKTTQKDCFKKMPIDYKKYMETLKTIQWQKNVISIKIKNRKKHETTYPL